MPSSLALRFLAAAAITAAALIATPATAQVDGEPDPTFNGDGFLTNGNEPYSAWTARAAAVLPNQDTVVVGDLTTSVGMDHLTINAAGTAIATCQAGVPLLVEFEGLAVLADRGGRLVVAGSSTFSGAPDQQRALIGRFTSANSCVFDSAWSGNGWQILDGESFCDGEDCAVIDVAESPTHGPRLYALLSSRVNALVSRLFVVAFGANGAVDSSFGAGGYAEVTAPDLGSLSGTGAQLVVDAGGRPLVLAARFDPDVALDADPFLLRLTDGGELDTTFDDDGVDIINDSSSLDEFPAGLVLGADGAVTFALNWDSGDTSIGLAYVMRPDGSRTGAAFGHRRVAGVAVQGDGKPLVLVDNVVDDGMEIARLVVVAADLELDPSFGDGGIYPLDVDLGGADWEQPTAIVLATGRPWLVGRAAGDSGAGMFAARLRNRYVFADSFEIGSTSFWRR